MGCHISAYIMYDGEWWIKFHDNENFVVSRTASYISAEKTFAPYDGFL